MLQLITFVCLITALSACQHKPEATTTIETVPVESKLKQQELPVFYSSIHELASDTNWNDWRYLSPDQNFGDSRLTFDADTAYLSFEHSGFRFPMHVENDEIVLTYVEVGYSKWHDYTLMLGDDLEIGKPFARYKLIDSVTLKANYVYPGWIKFPANYGNDSILPRILHLEQPEYAPDYY